MADLLDAINFLEIQNNKSGTRAEARLRDLEGRAEYLAKTTGNKPVNWYEFTREVPPEQPSYLKNATIGAGMGAVFLGGIAAVLATPVIPVALLSGALLGGLVGGYHNTENTSRAKQVDAYEHYLNQFEAAKGHVPSPHISHTNTALTHEFERIAAEETKFTDMLANEAQKEKDCGCKGR